MLENNAIYATRKAVRGLLRSVGIRRTSGEAIDMITGKVNSMIEDEKISTKDEMNDVLMDIAVKSRKLLVENSDRDTLMLIDVTTAMETFENL